MKNILIDGNGCWLWQLRVNYNGYGQISTKNDAGHKSNLCAHRVSYKEFKGLIPTGYHIDHLCKTRSCINPEHLEAVTPRENVRRSNAKYKQQQARTHCPKGHEYSTENTFIRKTRIGGIGRECKRCDYDRHKKAREVRKMVLA